MDSVWDLDSVMELCCSKLSPEAELPSFNDGGNLPWLDEKVDLSPWVDLDFPDDLPSAAMLEDSPPLSHGSPSDPAPSFFKLGTWESGFHSAPLSPEFLSPPSSPNTPTAVVPNVDLFLNVGSSIEATIPPVSLTTEEQQAQYAGGLCEASMKCEEDRLTIHEPDSLSPPLTPTIVPSPFQVVEVVSEPETTGNLVSSGDILTVSQTCSSPDACKEEEEDTMDEDFVPDPEEASDSDDPESPGPSCKKGRSSKSRGRQPRRRRGADPRNRRERKRLQNKDAATRYRRKKKQECDLVEGVMKELNDTNQKLKSEAERLANEISYLKGLMREMFKAKGLLK